jgi:hypothetical protein
MVPTHTIGSSNKETLYAIWYPATDDDPAEWLCDHLGRVFLFTKAGAAVVKAKLDVDPRRPLEIKPYTEDGQTVQYYGKLLE